MTIRRINFESDLISLRIRKRPTDLVAQLNKAKAISQDYIRAIHGDALSLVSRPPDLACWLFPTCINVHGTVRKLLNPGSARPAYATICQGTVQIFQVDLECTLDTLAHPTCSACETAGKTADPDGAVLTSSNPGDRAREYRHKIAAARRTQAGAS